MQIARSINRNNEDWDNKRNTGFKHRIFSIEIEDSFEVILLCYPIREYKAVNDDIYQVGR